MLSEEAVLGFEYGYIAGRAQRARPVGGAVRRLRQRRAGRLRPVHLLGRAQMAAHVGPRAAAAARLRGPGAGALLGAARALSAAVRRGQLAGRQLHDAGQLLPHPAPPAAPQVPQAAGADDAEVAAAPQARRLGPRANSGPDTTFHRLLWDDAQIARGREDQAQARRRDPARGAVLRQGLLRPLRGARERRHRRRLPAAHGAALSVPGPRADQRAVALPAGRDRVVPGGAQEHGRLELHRAQPRVGAGAHRGQAPAAALCRAPGVGGDGDRT